MDPSVLPDTTSGPPASSAFHPATATATATATADGAAAGAAALKPWEQHGGVINMPRYLYSSHAAPLLHRSGFLITCAFQREKSATKEAMEILHQFLSISTGPCDGVEIEPDAKRARTGAYVGSAEWKSPGGTKVEAEPPSKEGKAEEVEGHTSRSEVQGDVDGANTGDEDSTRNCVGVDNGESLPDNERGIALRSSLATEIKQQEFHLVKLARNGMVYISIPSRSPGDLVKFFAKIINDFHTRSRAAPRWCHRIFPVQATCPWIKEDVRSNVVVLVKDFIKGHNTSSNNPLKYAVAVNRRGLEEKGKTIEGAAPVGTFGKLECIHAVAEAIQSLTPYVSVDLTNPEMVVILEVLPLVRVETSVCAVSVLPRELVVTKPKLVIQGLAPPKQQKEKKQ
ncbi:hypothetical protein M758_2G248300 [Ceratodon purpureus]|uniref:THUMP domain-containing protein n=1 Tax=Ceratodon purpureus TaxID=3225 RepID=A0A8T0J0U0_CERPU|nr:hypothetical protein KC19_2G293900 [Ceratodon purpureus]KAG0628081.1 hypothetical protein M758_2G248300 [Ceratodon purpureus]